MSGLGGTVLRANELIPILAERFDYPFDAAYRVNRALAESGLRAKGKGRSLPDMSRREALIFLIACMVVDKLTKADAEVTPWILASGQVNQLPPVEPDDWGPGGGDDYTPEIRCHYDMMEAHFSSVGKSAREFSLVDYLLILCSLIESKEVAPDVVRLELDLSGLSAAVHFLNKRGEPFFTDQFFVLDPETGLVVSRPILPTGIQRRCTVSGTAIAEIIQRT